MLVAVEAGVGLAGILNSPGTSPTPGPRGGGEDGGWSLCGGLYCTTLTLHWLQPQIPGYEGGCGVGGSVGWNTKIVNLHRKYNNKNSVQGFHLVLV